jgi:hypothetical protein
MYIAISIARYYNKTTNQIGGRSMTNAAALGYMIKAANEMGLSLQQIRVLEATMRDLMDFITESRAEEIYRKF